MFCEIVINKIYTLSIPPSTFLSHVSFSHLKHVKDPLDQHLVMIIVWNLFGYHFDGFSFMWIRVCPVKFLKQHFWHFWLLQYSHGWFLVCVNTSACVLSGYSSEKHFWQYSHWSLWYVSGVCALSSGSSVQNIPHKIHIYMVFLLCESVCVLSVHLYEQSISDNIYTGIVISL